MNTAELILILQSFPPDAIIEVVRPWIPTLNGMKPIHSVKLYKAGDSSHGDTEKVVHIT